MSSEKIDRRKQYTRMVLQQSLMSLLKEKRISSITVKEICALADINRSTFYAHYSDHFALLEQIEEELIADMNTYLSNYELGREDQSLQMTEKLIEYFATKQEECQTLLSDNSNSSFEQKVNVVARQYMMENWQHKTNIDMDITEYMSSYVISGSIEVMKVWLDNDMDKSPKEIAALITTMINSGIGAIQ